MPFFPCAEVLDPPLPEVHRLVDDKGDQKHRKGFQIQILHRHEPRKRHRHRHVEYVDVEGRGFADPLVVEAALGAADAEEELEQAHGGKNTADVHLDLAVGGAPQRVLHHLQGEKSHAQHAVDDLRQTATGPLDPRQQIPQTKAGQAEEPGVAHVPHLHRGLGLE